ncbi:MAG: DUF4492 domain-containing protein [Candidatus Paraprevotella stercoravium]|jgi:TM2 domain-containing membrane protein YozV|uniref:DUF4492 domain-containing protein n=2 Tax=Bacteroidales TaxID=171549 RepID=A0ABT7U6G0_9BACE|nr:DUF4492 domain-containing protein [Candidatus Paraprevotella stercoravium]MDM8145808.1 DUF4492 domain-containing protein [Bacteroides eggerthii]
MNVKKTLFKIWSFYYQGFKEMTLGRILWAIILLKLFVLFFVLRIFFFPDYVATHADEGEEAQFVGEELVERMVAD